MAKLHVGAEFSITRILSGAGKVDTAELENLTGVCEPKQTLLLDDCLMLDRGVARLDVLVSNRELTESYPLNQVGIYAQDPDEGEILYLILQETLAADVIPAEAQAPGYVTSFEITIIFGNAEKLTAIIDPAGWATRKWVLQQIEKWHPTCELITIPHNLSYHPGIEVFGGLEWGAGMGGAGNGPAGGTAMEQLPIKAIWEDKNTLTLYTTQAAARPGVEKQLHGGGHEWTVTFEGDELSSLYILLTGGLQSGQPPSGSAIVHTGNMVFCATPPQDASLIWGDTSKGA
ncbi:MAG: hypothetical protein HFG27_08615 [Provencibacterium sp.]|nr:hypothetical protein [Provencibacterium sp.]